jgi:tetrahydromethanopterin S-methyltransferase subunit B
LPLFLNFLSNNAGVLFGSVIGILLEIFLKKFLPPTLVIEEGLEMAEVAENRDQQVVVIAAGPAEEKSEPVVSRAADVREDSGNPLTPVFNRFPANDQKSYQHSFFRSASFDKTKKATLPANKRRANSF